MSAISTNFCLFMTAKYKTGCKWDTLNRSTIQVPDRNKFECMHEDLRNGYIATKT